MTQSITKPTYSIPPLENGDRLTRAEFERRYEGMPNLKKAELIEGIVCLAAALKCNALDRSPTSLRSRGSQDIYLYD
jgi:hypothetical protein